MPLGRLQGAIVDNLSWRSFLDEDQSTKLKSTESELNGRAFDELLLGEYKISLHQLNVAKANAYGVPPFNVKSLEINVGTWEILDQAFCEQHGVVPVSCVGNYIVVAFSNPFELSISSKISEVSGKQVVTLLSPEQDIKEVLNQDTSASKESKFDDVIEAVGIEFDESEDLDEDLLDDEECAPIIQLVNRIIEDAHNLGASDIHVEPREKELVVRYRIDGVCQEKLRLPTKVTGSLIARLKIMSNLDIAERRLPQDGRIVFKQFTRKNIDIDLRVATAPLNHGEGVVMRILD